MVSNEDHLIHNLSKEKKIIFTELHMYLFITIKYFMLKKYTSRNKSDMCVLS